MALARYSLPRRGVYAQAMLPSVSMSDLLAGQFYPRDFRRYDLLVRARVVRAWLTHETDAPVAEACYEQMQRARGATVNLPRFRALVDSVVSEGMNPDFPVGLSPWGPLLDGAHRVAIALARGVARVAVDVRNSSIPVDYSRAWLAAAGVSDADLEAADALLDEFLATTGHDTIVAICADVFDEHWGALRPGADVVAHRLVVLDADATVALEDALTYVAWHEHDKRANIPTRVLRPGPVTILRLRLQRPQWQRVPKTHVRVSSLATSYLHNLRSLDVPARVGLTWSQNKNAVAVLAGAGATVWGQSDDG